MKAADTLTHQDLGRIFSQRDRFMKLLGAELIEIGAGHAVVRMPIREEHMSFNGTCHGGVIFSLADCAFGVSSNSHNAVAAGINANINYLSAAHVGDVLTAVSQEVSCSRKLATYNIAVTDSQNSLIASFAGTVYILGKTHNSSLDAAQDGD